MYLEVKLRQDRCGWYIYKLKNQQNGRIKVLTDKQATTNVPLTFLSVKTLQEMQQRLFLEAVNQEQRYSACI